MRIFIRCVQENVVNPNVTLGTEYEIISAQNGHNHFIIYNDIGQFLIVERTSHGVRLFEYTKALITKEFALNPKNGDIL